MNTDQQALEHLIAAADDAINAGEFDTVVGFYTDDAVLVPQPGHTVRGKEDIRQTFDRIAAYFNQTLRVSQSGMQYLIAGDTALVLSPVRVEAEMADGRAYLDERAATYVFKRGPDGKWRCAIDNSYGTTLLGATPPGPP